MTTPLETTDLGKRYGKRWALTNCTLSIPVGSVTALIGPNGAGKSTLMRLAAGLSVPTTGTVRLFGEDPNRHAARVLPRFGYVAQDHPLFRRFSVSEMLEFGRRMNQTWDQPFAMARLSHLGIDPRQKVGKLSGGQMAQVALVLALAKRPELILLDEPMASLDPLARREFLQVLMESVAVDGTTVILSSHNVVDLERVCDHLVILSRSQVQIAEALDSFLFSHRLLVGLPAERGEVERVNHVVQVSTTERQTTLLVRKNGHVYDARWDVRDVGFEEIVLGYLSEPVTGRSESVERVAS